MSMKTAPAFEGKKSGKTFRIAIICANFNPHITGKMLESAQMHAREQGLTVVHVIEVPGTLEIPFATQRMLRKKEVDAAVCLGAIIQGSTKHDELVGFGANDALLRISLELDKPIGMGIIGPGATETLAKERAEEYGRRAVLAVAQMLNTPM